jgi:cell division GTPase FtsZ
MGGGTGTGAAPLHNWQRWEILTVGIVTIPFSIWGKVRQEQTLLGVERLQ